MAATFSYAQAAKGLAAPAPGRSPITKPQSEAAPNPTPKSSEPQADVSQPLSLETSTASSTSAQDSQGPAAGEKQITSQDTKPNSPLQNGVSPPASPDFGVSSTSTLVKDDDQSSAVHTSSESTWENKSQASAVADTTNGEAVDTGRAQTKDQSVDAENEAPPAKPLQDAPPPVVNIWKQRAEQRAAHVPTPSKASTPTKRDTAVANKSHSLPEASLASATKAALPPRERKPETGLGRNQSEPRSANPRGEDSSRARRSQAPRSASHEVGVSANEPLPPPRDQEFWPTPESAIEERKKSVDKGERSEKLEKLEEDSAEKKKAHGKSAWTHVPFTPTVVFSTPLPGTGRRGGRGGGRGGREDTARGPPTVANGVSATADDKRSSLASVPAGDGARRARPDPGARSSSPVKSKAEATIPGSAASSTQQPSSAPGTVSGKSDAVNGELAPVSNGHARRFSLDRAPNTNGPISNRGGSTRGRGRRGDFVPNSSERRRDVDTGSTAGDQVPALGQKAAQPDAAERRKKSISEEGTNTTKQQPFDRRNGGFSTYPNPRERGEPRTRGGARGRGGSHHFQASQQIASPQYGSTNGSVVPQPYGYPPSSSPPGWSQGQPSPYFTPQSQHSRGYRGGAPRAQSIPTDMGYGAYGHPYATPPPQMLPLQTQLGYPYDPQAAAQSMSASAYGPYADQYSLFAMVMTQLEYYFSVDNLIKDVYLRRHMDSQGFVALSVIANFSRMKKLTTDVELIKFACSNSKSVEWRVTGDGKDYLRPARDWQQWVMPVEDRETSARNDGPSELFMPSAPVPQGFDNYSLHMRHSVGGPHPHSAAAASAPWQQINGGRVSHNQSPMSPSDSGFGNVFPPPPHQPLQNGVDAREQYASRPFTTNGQNHVMDPEADTFSDTAATKLMVVVGNSNGAGGTVPTDAAHTLSNGSVDGKDLTEGAAPAQRHDSGPIANGDDSHRGRTGRADHAPSASHGSSASIDGTKICWTKSDDCPPNMVPGREETERYPALRQQALNERAGAPEGACPHNLIVLYKFWSHFLLRNFNTNMYSEFRHLALQDYHERQTDVGYHNLLKYYQCAFASTERPIRERVAKHYAQLADSERQNDNDQEQVALKQLREQWQDSTLDQHNREKLGAHLGDELKASLEA